MFDDSISCCVLCKVAWQQLTEDSSSSGMSQQSGSLLSAAAVVTSQRLLIVGPDLTILASTPQRSSGASITSALWVGPALLYCDSANAVRGIHAECHSVWACGLGVIRVWRSGHPQTQGCIYFSKGCSLLATLLVKFSLCGKNLTL